MKTELGECRFEDCMEGMRDVESGTFDACVTDPPYGINYINKRKAVWTEPLKNDKEAFTEWLPEVYRILNETGVIFCFATHVNYPIWRAAIEALFIYKTTIIWDTGNHTAGNLDGNYGCRYQMIIVASKQTHLTFKKRPVNLICLSKSTRANKRRKFDDHPTSKPAALYRKILEPFYFNSVIDPFAGGCVIGEACEALSKKWLAFEVNQDYKRVVEKRVCAGMRQAMQGKLFDKLGGS